MGATTTLMTFEEFERLPDEEAKLELLDGEVTRMPPPETRHMRIALRLYELLRAVVLAMHGNGRGAGLGEVVIEFGYRIGPHWLIPDVSITHPGQTENKYLEGAPALAVEVISEANTARMMDRKIRRYLEAGALEVWLVYPETKSVWVYRGQTAVAHEGTLTSDLLPDRSIDLTAIFA